MFEILCKFGFVESFIQWVKDCIGSPPWGMVDLLPFFLSERGIKQGGPLSPLLYAMMVDSLSERLKQERIANNFQGNSIVKGAK